MERKFKFGKVAAQTSRKENLVTVEVELKEKEEGKPVFTASATVWNRLHTDCIMGGQCLDTIFDGYYQQLENKELFKKIYYLWKRNHLNDMNAWCEHQEYGKGVHDIKVKVHHLRGNDEYKRLAKVRELPDEYLEVTEEGLKNVPMALYEHSTLYGNRTGIEEKDAGWITYDPVYAPEGMIGKVCPECGAKYGHAWYYRPINENDLKSIGEVLSL